MALKRAAAVIVDEVATGSYHTSTLEGLSVGRAVAVCLDPRTEQVMKVMAGAEELPLVNTDINSLALRLIALLKDPAAATALGRRARAWMEAHWSDERLVRRYEEMYATLMEHPDRVRRQAALRFDEAPGSTCSIIHSDRLHRDRCATHWRAAGLMARWRVRRRRIAAALLGKLPVPRNGGKAQ